MLSCRNSTSVAFHVLETEHNRPSASLVEQLSLQGHAASLCAFYKAFLQLIVLWVGRPVSLFTSHRWTFRIAPRRIKNPL